MRWFRSRPTSHLPPAAKNVEAGNGGTLSMEERIQAFYRQSGGPNNPDIEKILSHHLKYGKDHGTPGVIETVKDAIRAVFLEDKSLKVLYDKYHELKDENERNRIRKIDAFVEMGREIRTGIESSSHQRLEQLEAELSRLDQMVSQLIDELDRKELRYKVFEIE